MQLRIRYRRARRSSLPFFLVALTGLTASTLCAHAQYSPRPVGSRQSTGATPHQVVDGSAPVVGHYNPDQMLRLALTVQPPHMAEEEQFLKELETKGSPTFHKFLSPEEWNARFGPSVADEQKIVDWAKSQGLTVTQRYPNRLLVDVEAPAGVIEKAFGVTINRYQVGSAVEFSNDHDPAIPTELSGILSGVLGMNSIQRVHGLMPKARTMRGPDYVPGPVISQGAAIHGDGDPAKAAAARLPHAARPQLELTAPGIKPDSQTVSPFWIFGSQAYNYDGLYSFSHCCNPSGATGATGGAPATSSIALVTFGDFENSDVNAFFSYYGFAYDYVRIYIDGDGAPAQDDEAPGDLEYSTATSNSYGSWQDTAAVYIYEINSNLYSAYADAYNTISSNNYARVISTSYGSAEEDWDQDGYVTGTGTGQFHGIFNSLAGEGYTMIASAGDSGSAQDCGDAVQVNWPASDPNFLAAGGTGLTLDSSGNFVSETAWVGDQWSGACADNWGGGGGGASALFSKPSWQDDQSGTQRLMPDMSLNADPDTTWEYYYYGGGWSTFDGTSIVAPELAGFFAQEDSYLTYEGSICGSGSTACAPLGNADPWLYQIGNIGAPHFPFYDITSGCNSNDITTYYGLAYFCAGSGYDEATGWGSANMMQLAWGINWWIIPAVGTPSITFTSGPATNTWYNSDQIIAWTLSDADGEDAYPAPGPAGFTQGWDSIPTDSYSEPHGGTGDSFYYGPQYAGAVNGCLDFTGGSCAGSSGQGCHTVWVQGWDNQGRTTTNSYGPVCYDSVSPTISASTNPATSGTLWVNQPVVVTLTASDPGGSSASSGIYITYYAINTGSCYPGNLGACYFYGSPFTISGQQQSYIYYFTEDNAGNFSGETYIWVSIDTTPPTTTASLSGTISSGSVYSTDVTVTLNAADSGGSGVHYTYFQRNGGPVIAYTGPFITNVLGAHTVKYWSVDYAGNVEAAHTISYTISSPTTATLVASPKPAGFGQPVTMTATVTATLSGTPTGSVTFWNGATNLGSATLSGNTATLTTTALPLGALTLQASYVGNADYLPSNSAPFDETVNKGTPVITWLTPASITYGTEVGPTQQDATANVPGTFAYAQPAGWKPTAGTHTMTVTFTPTNTTDYKTATASVTLTVTKATPAITWANPPAIIYGKALSATQLDATSKVAGTFVYTPDAGTVLTVGSQTLSVTFTPTDTADYTTAAKSVTLTVTKGTPVVTWPTPAPITVGTAVGPTQQDATANVPGTFAYAQPAGWKPTVGTHTMTVTFTPTDTTDYKIVTATVTLTVNPAS